MISAWARMCKILGKEFQEYLPLVMPPVLKAASLKPEVALLDSEYCQLCFEYQYFVNIVKRFPQENRGMM